MTDLPETAPVRPRRPAGSTRSRKSTEDLEQQVARLQDDLKSITATLARLGNQKVSEVRDNAEGQYKSLVRSGQHVVDDLGSQAGALEDQLKQTIREKPLTAVATAVGVGFVIALLTQR